MNATILPSFSKKIFGGYKYVCFGCCFGLLVMSSPGFQCQGGLLAYMLYWLHIVYITSGASMVAHHIPYMHFSA